MTHTLHRTGTKENLQNDYVVFLMAAQKVNTAGSKEKLQKYLRIAKEYGAVNIGDGREGCLCDVQDYDWIVDRIKDGVVAHAVFDSQENVSKVLTRLKKEDLGISVVVSGLMEQVGECCKEAGLHPHSVNFSLGVHGRTDKLPPQGPMEIMTMCGHGMITADLIYRLVERIQKGTVTATEAARQLGALCICGVFNPTRAAALLAIMAQEK